MTCLTSSLPPPKHGNACAGVPLYAEPEKQNCAALLALVSLLWCTEVTSPLPLPSCWVVPPHNVPFVHRRRGSNEWHSVIRASGMMSVATQRPDSPFRYLHHRRCRCT